MQKVSYNPPIPRSGQSLLGDFADVKLKNRLSDLGTNQAAIVYKVGTEDGTVEVPFLPGWIYIRAVYPDGTVTLEKCYVPTYEDGTTKVLFEPDQVISPRRSSDQQPTYWIYDGIAPTPRTKTSYLANSFDTTGINPAAFDSLGQIVHDQYLPSHINVDRMLDGTASALSWSMTDTGKKDSEGQRLWNVKYTGADFNTDTSDVGHLQLQANGTSVFVAPAPTAPLPPTGNPILQKLFDPCNPDQCQPTDPNYPNCDPSVPGRPVPGLPVHNPTLPPIPIKTKECPTGYKSDGAGGCVAGPNPKIPNKPKLPPDGFRLPPNSPKQRPPTLPYIPPPSSPNPPGPPTGPGQPPPPSGPGGGGDWHDDGTFVSGCFGIPYKLDAQIVVTNDTSEPNLISTTLQRSYYDIRAQIDTAIKLMVNDGTYQQKGLIWVVLLFDGINEEEAHFNTAGLPPVVTVKDWSVPRVFHTVTTAGVTTDQLTYFHGPTSLFNDNATTLPFQVVSASLPPDLTVDSHYRVWGFDSATIGSDTNPIRCNPLHYSYKMNTLPAYDDNLLQMLADHPGYRLYLSCFKYQKSTPAAHVLPYTHDFGDGNFDGWIGYDQTGPLGHNIARRGAIEHFGPFHSPQWISGWTVTVTGWSDNADDLFNTTTLANGHLDFHAFADGTLIASGSKNMFHPYANHSGFYEDKPDTFTWTVNNIGGALSGPCVDYSFNFGGGNIINSILIHKMIIAPIFSNGPAPVGSPTPTGPSGGGGGGSGDPNAPRNAGPNPIPKGSPVGPPYNPAAGPGDDGSAAPKQKPANGGASSPSPAVGIAPDDVPADQPVKAKSSGSVNGYSGLAPGKPVYLSSTTPGSLTQEKPTCSGCLVQQLGTATDSTTVEIDIGPATRRI